MLENSIMKDDLHDSYWLDLETTSHTMYTKDGYTDEDTGEVEDFIHHDIEGHHLWKDAEEDELTVLSAQKDIDKTLWFDKTFSDCYLTKSSRIFFHCLTKEGKPIIISDFSQVAYTRELTSEQCMGYICNHLFGVTSA